MKQMLVLLLVVMSATALAQSSPAVGIAQSLTSKITAAFVKTISGKVTDPNGDGLPGVNVLEKGTNNGTTTDANGFYVISVHDTCKVLTFSFVGYLGVEVAINNSGTVDVIMNPDTSTAIDERRKK